jgi:hypothetical protein
MKYGHAMILFGLPIIGIDSGFVRIKARFDDRGRSLPTKRIKTQVLRVASYLNRCASYLPNDDGSINIRVKYFYLVKQLAIKYLA